eukprot:m.101869 g.101869  ORF g.101869 m.101869 type:complete len:422 (-) comp8978_c2_seq1:355-1620(-)
MGCSWRGPIHRLVAGSGLLLLKLHDNLILGKDIAGLEENLADLAGAGSEQAVLHLHGLDDGDLLAGGDQITLGNGERHEGAGHGRLDDRAKVLDLLLGHVRCVLVLRLRHDGDVKIGAAVAEVEHVAVAAEVLDDGLVVGRLRGIVGKLHVAEELADVPLGENVLLLRVRSIEVGDGKLGKVGRDVVRGSDAPRLAIDSDNDGHVRVLAEVPVLFLIDARVLHDASKVHKGGGADKLTLLVLAELVAVEALGVDLGDKVCGDIAADEAGLADNVAEKGDVVVDAADDVRVEGALHLLDGVLAVLAVGDELADHGIVVHADLAALDDASVDADAGEAGIGRRGLNVSLKAAGGGEEEVGILGVDAGLNGPAVDANVVLGDGEGLALGNADHLLDNVDAGDALGDGVLDLEAGVHLQKVKVAL